MRLLAGLILVGLAVWLGPPLVATQLGIHPRYTGPRYQLPGKSVLIVTTSHDQLGEGGARTGVFASEMTAPYYEFLTGGMTVDIASIKGGAVPVDPLSFNWIIEAPSDKRFKYDAEFQRKVAASFPIASVDVAKYDIVFLAGGWGAAYDLGPSNALAAAITKAWAAGKVVGGICHGPLGLLGAIDEGGAPLVKGRRVTAVTDKQVRELGISITPQHPERELRAAGALFESHTAFRDFFSDYSLADGRLVTGQNQNAGPEVAQLMMKIAGGQPLKQ